MKAAVERINGAASQKRISIYGIRCDGISMPLYEGFGCWVNVIEYVPHRGDEGYGLN